jgi:hypothetical protein
VTGLVGSLLVVLIPAPAQATGPGYLTLSFGRAQWVTSADCLRLPNTVALDQVAGEFQHRGLVGTGNVVLARALETTRLCLGKTVLYASWADIAALRDLYGWTFITASADYKNMTTLTVDQQRQESCDALPTFVGHGHSRAWGLFAYPNNKYNATVQTDVVSKCFAYGRTYQNWSRNLRAQMAPPWFQKTHSLKGGACQHPGLPCYTVSVTGGTRYQSPVTLSKLVKVTADQWVVLQAYRFVTGAYTGTRFSWDCTSSDWHNHWTNAAELYCWGDYLTVLGQIPSGVVVTDPTTVAQAWGRIPDTTPPTTTITSGPSDPISDTSATFEFAAGEPAASFTCTLDAGTPAACDTGVTYPALEEGIHTFSVHATDAAGNVGPEATWTWTVDTTPPTTTITSGPPDVTPDSSATFEFSADEPGASFTCTLDGGVGASCDPGVTYSALEVGIHTFSVHATDAAGNPGDEATWTWIVGAPP